MKHLKIVIAMVALLLAAPGGDLAAQVVRDIRVVNDRAPDCASLKSIVESITRHCKTDDQRVIAIYNFCRFNHYHHAYPTEEGGAIGALKMMNVYGWGLCGGEHSVQAALWDAAGYKYRYRGWSDPGHTTVEVSYGGRWHYLDTFLKFYCWMPDPANPGKRTIAGQEDIRANPALVNEGFVIDKGRNVAYHKDNRFEMVGPAANWTAPAFMVCGDDLPGLIRGIRSSKDAGSPRGWASVKFDDPGYSTAVDLGAGYALTLHWDALAEDAWYFRGSKKSPRHTCGDKEYRNCPVVGPLLEPYNFKGGSRSWANGTLTFKPDLRNDAFLAGLKDVQNVALKEGTILPKDPAKPASLVIEMASPYVVARASGQITGVDAKAEVSIDGKTWGAADLANLGASLAGKYRYLVRLTFAQPIRGIELTSIVQLNPQALPYLAPGKNTITLTSAGGADATAQNRVVVTYAYIPGWREASPEKLCDQGAEIARRHQAKWPLEKPVVVQKVIDKFPVTFDILVPTPRGKQPVYPRMLFVRREVLAPGQEPMAVPAAPSEPQVGPDQALLTLPEPWTMGIEAPAAPPARPTRSSVLPAARTSYVSKKGEVQEHQFIKWLKDSSDASVLLAAFDAAQLPDARSLASATLVLYVHESHDKAPMQVAATMLEAPFEAGKPFDFAKLGASVGTTIVEKGNGPGGAFVPPRKYEIDVTRAVRAWIAGVNGGGAACHGLGVRIVPNRSVDDGWTVRFTPSKDKSVELQITRFAEP